MANIKFTGTSYSIHTGTKYVVNLHDTSYSGSATVMNLIAPGIEFEYLQQGDEIYAPIKGSSCKVYIAITNDATGTALESWLYNTMLATTENRFPVSVYKDDNLFWVGQMLPDLGERKDASRPYQFLLQAADGLARLKDFDFDMGYAGGGSRNTFIAYLYYILQKTPLYLSSSFLGNTILFMTSVDWYEDQMDARVAGNDPLDMATVHSWAFTTYKQGDPARQMRSYYDVLEIICRAWGMRIIMSDGFFKFVQIQNYEDIGTARYCRKYSTLGAYDSYEDFNHILPLNVTKTSLPRVTASNQYQYFPPLKNVYLNFQFGNNLNMLDGGTSIPYNTYTNDYLLGGSNKRLNFQTSINIVTGLASWIHSIMYCEVSVEIKLDGGDYYLRKDVLGAMSWEYLPSSPYAWIEVFQFYPQNGVVNVSFQTPDLPAGFHSCEITIDVLDVYYSLLTSSSLTFAANRQSGTTSLKYNTSSINQQENYLTYQGSNTAGFVNSYDLELPDAVMGEMFQPDFYGGIYTGATGGSFAPSSGVWKLYDTGAANNFNMMLVKQVFSAQVLPIEKYQGGIIGATILPDSVFSYSSQVFILNGGTYNTQTETWQGEWFKVSYERASFQSIQDAVGEAGDNTASDLRGAVGNHDILIGHEGLTKGNYNYTTDASGITLAATSQVITITTSGSVTAPSAADMNPTGVDSAIITIINACAGGGDTVTAIGTFSGVTDPVLAQYECLTIMSDGTNLFKIKTV